MTQKYARLALATLLVTATDAAANGGPAGLEPGWAITTPVRYYEMCSYYLNGNVTPAECEELPWSLDVQWNNCIDLLRTMHDTAGHSHADFFHLHYLFLSSQYAAIAALASAGEPVALPVDRARQAFLGILDAYYAADEQLSREAARVFFATDTCHDPVADP